MGKLGNARKGERPSTEGHRDANDRDTDVQDDEDDRKIGKAREDQGEARSHHMGHEIDDIIGQSLLGVRPAVGRLLS